MGLFRKPGERDVAVADEARAPDAAAPKKESVMAMLRRDEAAAGGAMTVLGAGSSFEGKLTFEGNVRIEGAKFSGEIHTNDTLVIAEGARVEAEINAGTVIISGGEIVGNIRAKTLIELERGAKVRGNIETPSLKIDKGVIFEGGCKMSGEAKVTSLADKLAPKA